MTGGGAAGHLGRTVAAELLIARERGPLRGAQVLVRADLDATD